MSELVVINGIIQHKHAYMVSGDSIVFHTAPPNRSDVSILMDDTRYEYIGDGTTFVFQGTPSGRMKFRKFMEEVYEKKDDPTVKDALEKLKIVMELVK
jgi:hypothetical protein